MKTSVTMAIQKLIWSKEVIMKRILNSDGQQSHEYQQNEQIASTSTLCKLKKTIAYDVGNPDPDLLQAQ